MGFDYFYGEQAEQFAFYRIPKVLFTNVVFKEVSADAKTLYGILLDRMNLSAKNGWLDENGRVYIIFTIEEIMSSLGCADQKATKLLNELESKCGLIERKRQGLGKPNLIYVKNFIELPLRSRLQSRENHDSGQVKITTPEYRKSRCSNTELNNTDYSDINPFPSSDSDAFTIQESQEENQKNIARKEAEGNVREQYRNYFSEQLQIEYLTKDYPYDADMLRELLELMVDTVCTRRKTIRIAGDDKPAEVVKSQFMKLDSEHIRLVLSGMKENTTKIRNMRQYLLAALYNAPLTISNYYSSLVQHDMNSGLI